jgi:hypothetical protein
LLRSRWLIFVLSGAGWLCLVSSCAQINVKLLKRTTKILKYRTNALLIPPPLSKVTLLGWRSGGVRCPARRTAFRSRVLQIETPDIFGARLSYKHKLATVVFDVIPNTRKNQVGRTAYAYLRSVASRCKVRDCTILVTSVTPC